jgi:hypothetical protein
MAPSCQLTMGKRLSRLPSTWPPSDHAARSRVRRYPTKIVSGRNVGRVGERVCGDIAANHPHDLQRRGHVAVAMLDSLSQFAYPCDRQHIRIPRFVEQYFRWSSMRFGKDSTTDIGAQHHKCHLHIGTTTAMCSECVCRSPRNGVILVGGLKLRTQISRAYKWSSGRSAYGRSRPYATFAVSCAYKTLAFLIRS